MSNPFFRYVIPYLGNKIFFSFHIPNEKAELNKESEGDNMAMGSKPPPYHEHSQVELIERAQSQPTTEAVPTEWGDH